VRVLELSQDLPLAAKALHAGVVVETELHELDRDAFVEFRIVAYGFVDEAHAAGGNAPHDPIRAKELPRARVVRGGAVPGLEVEGTAVPGGRRVAAGVEQRADRRFEPAVAGARACEKRVAVGRR